MVLSIIFTPWLFSYTISLKSIRRRQEKRELFEQEHNMKELAAVEKCPYSLDELNSMIRDVDERSEDIREAIEQYHHQLDFEPKLLQTTIST